MNNHCHAQILAELARLYPAPKPELHFSNPYETLVATMLSAQCTDRQVNLVTPAVFRDFPTAADMAKITPEILYPYVKSCGFKSKAVNIVSACKIICEKHGGQVPDTLEDLTALPGVGRKTANVVLANAFGVPAFAVDTHVQRVSNRLGLVQSTNPEKTEQQLTSAIPPAEWNNTHHRLIYHGRRVCHAGRPDCEHCTLKNLCDYHQKTEK